MKRIVAYKIDKDTLKTVLNEKRYNVSYFSKMIKIPRSSFYHKLNANSFKFEEIVSMVKFLRTSQFVIEEKR